MKRIIMMVLRNILLVPWMWAKLCYHASHVDKYTEEEHYRMLRFITHRANKGGNVTIDAHGLENIPEENGFMFFPNHHGLFSGSDFLQVPLYHSSSCLYNHHSTAVLRNVPAL